ncbi:MAG: energy transducer TonB [Bacteroidales bacterium]|nr:energy transducer TonB [Bacteroidales bacterium]
MKQTLLLIMLLALGLPAYAQSTDGTTSKDPDAIFVVVEKNPEYPGGTEAMYQFLAANIQYPKDAKAEKKEGRVLLTFVVEADGRITDIKALHSPHPSLSEEAIRVVRLMPKWKPGKQRGKKVRVQYNLPINFQLQ